MRLSQLIRILWAHRLTSLYIVGRRIGSRPSRPACCCRRSIGPRSAIVVDVRANDPLSQGRHRHAEASRHLLTWRPKWDVDSRVTTLLSR